MWNTRSERLQEEENGATQNLWVQHCHHITESLRSALFCTLHCEGEEPDLLHGGKYACVNYVSQILCLLYEGLWVGPPGTWMKYLDRDLLQAGWQQVAIEDAIMGDVVHWNEFDGNEHVGFIWLYDMAVSMVRVDPMRKESPRLPGIHPLHFDGPGRTDGPRTIKSIWTHPKLRASYNQNQ